MTQLWRNFPKWKKWLNYEETDGVLLLYYIDIYVIFCKISWAINTLKYSYETTDWKCIITMFELNLYLKTDAFKLYKFINKN